MAVDDAAEAADNEISIEQLIEANPRTWQEQWGRVNRWYVRFRAISEGRPHTDNSLVYEDEMYAFFECCYHLKDWLKNDPQLPVDGKRVETFVNDTEVMRWCADLANGSKHLIADRRFRIDPKLGLGQRHFKVTLGTGIETTVSAVYLIAGAGESRDAFALAGDCVQAWASFLGECGLSVGDE